ncbi:PQQ-binding-like beta-propeller repeat protein [Wenyingzhuangia aestuarii]|uniref:hypothetical protein n=1 Tax=Wenyingzhuangia aestuarii TaxID=1647582 RepID=UPI001438B9BC|nr:hypothetical protein [Wenyingzhuangia aestuarii]NJB83031.1 hypothetical protein [Wenyingzhuangia aestuarii]
MINRILYGMYLWIALISSVFAKDKQPSIKGIETGVTITKVVLGANKKENLIIASSYNGAILAIDESKGVVWKNELSDGIMNHEIITSDLNDDGYDEILAVNANGTLYCLDIKGNILWQFKQNNAPLISLCVIHKAGGVDPYIVCGGNDRNIYYVSKDGKLLTTIASTSYKTTVKPNKKWTDDGTLPKNTHTVNFLRALPQKDGSDILLLDGIVSNTDTKRELFQFKPMQIKPFKSKMIAWGPVGDSRVRNIKGFNNNMLLFGFSGIKPNYHFALYNPVTQKNKSYGLSQLKPKINFGYRVTQTEPVVINNTELFFVLLGERVYLIPSSLNIKKAEIIEGIFSYNDMCYNAKENKIILASVQSGGSQIHIIDLNNKKWKKSFKTYVPKGNITSILKESTILTKQLSKFKKPTWEKKQESLTMMSPPKDKVLSPSGLAKKNKYDNLIFMGYHFMKESHEWDRSAIESETLRTQRDGRKKYILSESEVVDKISKSYNKNGLATWGGHGVDPFMYGLETIKKVIDKGNGKMSVWIWPELTILHKKTFGEALDKLFYPLADYAGKHNSKLFLRTKHVFWQSYIYKKEWSRFLSGEFASAFIPALEETLDQTQDLSLAGRLGLWTSGVCNSWGTRAVRDNASYMRNRQFSHQNLPNHFLRNSIYHISYGADFVNNFSIKSKYSEYMTMLWDLVGTGALYVPKANEILSFSSVHLSMLEPDEVYLREGNSMNATIRYDKNFHPKNPFVFNRLSAEWSGAEVPTWDFSKYASGVKDRRSNFLAPYPNGMVLITPPQNGVFVQKNAVRGKLKDRLHPFYKEKLKEFYTDGRYYYSADGKQKYNADEYYKVIENEIKKASSLLPVTVSGDVAWVVAQTSPKHLRLTVIDKGYVNPKNRVAKVQFNGVKVKKITNLLSKKSIKVSKDGISKIMVSAGMFKFIDIELEEEFIK